jgi:hypothetical protein
MKHGLIDLSTYILEAIMVVTRRKQRIVVTPDHAYRPERINVIDQRCDAEWPSDCDSDGTEALRSPASMAVNVFEMK